jgi:hypothetical protein
MAVLKAEWKPDVGIRLRSVEATREVDGPPLMPGGRGPTRSANNHSSGKPALVE